MNRIIGATLATLLLSGCSLTPTTTMAVCAPNSRVLLLHEDLTDWTPSKSFSVAKERSVWAQITRLPITAGGPFGQVGPVAGLYYIKTGTTPRLNTNSRGDIDSNDPILALSGKIEWQELPIMAGPYQVYSNTNPSIDVISCPLNAAP